MAEAAEAYSLEEAANDLIEAPASSVPAAYDPGTIEADTPAESRSRGGLTVEQAADLIDDEVVHTGPTVAYHNGYPLKLSQLAQGFSEGAQLLEVLGDIHSRYRWVQQAGENVYVGALALADFIVNTIFPAPTADLAIRDPWEYQRAQVLHEQAIDATIQVVQYAQGIAQQQVEWASAQIPKDNLAFEAACFRETYPKANNPEWLKQFGERITRAAEHCGYHASELNAVTDHRALKVLDLAATALERRQGGTRPAVKSAKKAAPRLVSSNDDSISMSEAMLVDFD